MSVIWAEVTLNMHFNTILQAGLQIQCKTDVLCETHHHVCGNPFALQKWLEDHCIHEKEVLNNQAWPIYYFPFTSLSVCSIFKAVGGNQVLFSLPALSGGTELFSHLCLWKLRALAPGVVYHPSFCAGTGTLWLALKTGSTLFTII